MAFGESRKEDNSITAQVDEESSALLMEESADEGPVEAKGSEGSEGDSSVVGSVKPSESATPSEGEAESEAQREPGVADGLRTKTAPEKGAHARIVQDNQVAPMSAGGNPGFVAAGFGEIPKEKRRRSLKAFGITLGVLAGLVLIAYIAGAIVFMGRFLPHTTVGDHDVSMKTDAEVAEILEKGVSGYQLNIVGSGFSYKTTADEVGMNVDSKAVVSVMHTDLNAWQWPMLILQQGHDETEQLTVSYNDSLFEEGLTKAVETFNETATAPVDATIVYNEKDAKFVVKPEEAGTQYDVSAVLKVGREALSTLNPEATLSKDDLIQPKVFSTDEKLKEAAELATGMVSAKLTLVMAGQPVYEVNGNTISSFITMNDKLEVTFNEEAMDAWVYGLADSFNTVDTERTYTRADGKAIAVSGGVYGWEVDTEALKNAVLEGIKGGAVAQIDVPCSETAQVYNGAGQRDWGARYIDVDISEQYVRFYGADGAIIWEAPCITGQPDGKHDTVKGVWTVNAKESPSKLIGYENGKKIYESSVQYWMPFEGNGIGFHDATWQPSFGGTMYADGYGSHGCVNLSYNDAQALYGIIESGDVVVVHG